MTRYFRRTGHDNGPGGQKNTVPRVRRSGGQDQTHPWPWLWLNAILSWSLLLNQNDSSDPHFTELGWGELFDPSWVKREGDVLYLQQSFQQSIAILVASSQLLLVYSWFSCKWLLGQVGGKGGQMRSKAYPKVPDLEETALSALGPVQHLLLCGRASHSILTALLWDRSYYSYKALDSSPAPKVLLNPSGMLWRLMR